MEKRNIERLTNLNGRVYVYLDSAQIAEQFFTQAEAEGFTFGDGERPTVRHRDCVMAVNKNRTIGYVGFVGHMAFGSGTESVANESLIRVDYRRYLTGEEDFLYRRTTA